MHCAEFQQGWDDAVLRANGAWQTHLVGCPDCRRWHADMVRIDRTLRGLPQTQPAAGFERRVWRRMVAGNRDEKLRVFTPEAVTAGLVVAAAVFMLLTPMHWSTVIDSTVHALSSLSDLTLPWRSRATALIPIDSGELTSLLSITVPVPWLLLVLVVGAAAMHHGLDRLAPSRKTMSWSRT